MIVFETGKSGVGNRINDAEYVQPEIVILGVGDNQWDHSNIGGFSSTC